MKLYTPVKIASDDRILPCMKEFLNFVIHSFVDAIQVALERALDMPYPCVAACCSRMVPSIFLFLGSVRHEQEVVVPGEVVEKVEPRIWVFSTAGSPISFDIDIPADYKDIFETYFSRLYRQRT